MINSQPISSLQKDPREHLAVHSVFQTIQGEGPFAGHPALFVRLMGCNLQCPGCDTDYTHHTDTSIHGFAFEVYNKLIEQGLMKLVVITGGEPFRQNIKSLVNRLLVEGHTVQIETNGVFCPGLDFPWSKVTTVCSPKTGRIHPMTAQKVTAYKYVLSHDSVATDGLPELVLGHSLGRKFTHVARPPKGWKGSIYLQPMDANDPKENKLNIQAVVHSVLKHNIYTMGVQMHKLTNLP